MKWQPETGGPQGTTSSVQENGEDAVSPKGRRPRSHSTAMEDAAAASADGSQLVVGISIRFRQC